MSDAREEFGWLLAQAREHLLYYRDLGLTHIGEERKPATTEPLPAQTVETPRPTSPPPEVKTPEPSIIETPPPAFPKQEITMAKAKESQPAAMPSLFGEVAAAPTAAPVNETLEDIRLDLGECQRCKLWQTRTNIVFGEGNPKAELMFIGEAPGRDEDRIGKPFVGRAGQLLDKMLASIDLDRSRNCYITNVINWRPPDNRDPTPEEAAACLPFLRRHIELVDPQVLVLGEIRDEETAGVAVRAAATGHLMISTMHAGSCRGVWERLAALHADTGAAVSALDLVWNQRLVRRYCAGCAGAGKV